jgi:hypothetical protein
MSWNKELYYEITEFYNLTNQMLEVIEKESENKNRDCDIVFPLMEQVRLSADSITEIYAGYIKNKTLSKKDLRELEKSIRKVFSELIDLKLKIKNLNLN